MKVMRSLVAMISVLALAVGLGACTAPGGQRDHQAEMDANPEVAPAGDPTNGANGPSHSGSL